ncbi:triose-phosphate isomerase [Agrobacterium cavarae]|uniref:triose-phosphate isomerase n=1 Tax=Agrobacterium cavarae TaxID=2528239 RepID=UPI000715555B|nr:triose-phosphate isomerase [Agrobacterium cavarae]KQM34777.1 triosephosphate isomerase [Rhizobium sp. Leaf202]KQN87509.1 triosephosphate isomerase [Rhizobium sp. Leaf68]
MTPDIRPLVAGNWKMNGTRASLDQIKAMAEGVKGPLAEKVESLICPPSTLLYVATALCDDSPLKIGGQDCHQNASGAHTGDISAEMIADCFGTHVIVGHSERRTDHAETDHLVRAKASAAYAADLIAIICIGETAEQRKSGQTLDVLKRQLDGSLPDEAIAANTVIAYEPVWAIGTGLTPTVEDVREAHAVMREELVKRFGGEGRGMRILYGGSVKPSNASELMAIENVDGALIGGASLKASDFLSIYAAYEKLTA